MMDWVLDFYRSGLYTKANLKLYVEVNWITADQYKATTGDDYE